MTNEQLAILIRGYALRLDELIRQLDDEIPEDMERHLKWVPKEGKNCTPFELPRLNPDRWEQKPTGDYICLDGLRQFSAELWTQVDELSATKKLNAIKRSRRLK